MQQSKRKVKRTYKCGMFLLHTPLHEAEIHESDSIQLVLHQKWIWEEHLGDPLPKMGLNGNRRQAR